MLHESIESAEFIEFVRTTNDNQFIDIYWYIEEFGYFQSDLVINDCNSLNNIIIIEWNMIYHNVDIFYKRVKDIIIIKEFKIIRDNLHLCLHDFTNQW